MSRCEICGEENPDRARFCLACGAPLTAPAPAREVRKTVTILFSDVSGSTAIGERLDPESLRRIMSRYFSEVRSAVERHGGTVEKFIGDAVMAVFGIPQLHEDDALRAVRAAEDMRAVVEELNRELERAWGLQLRIRTGINTGEVVAGDAHGGNALVTGDAVNVAARLEQNAQPDEILLGEVTSRLVRDAVEIERLEPLAVKGKAEPVVAYRLIRVQRGAPAFSRHLDSPLVGREDELAALQQAYRRAVQTRSCHLFTVLGPAGVGKSRLIEELVMSVAGEALVLRGRCLPYGEGITYWPVSEVVREAAGIGDGDSVEECREKIASLLSEEDAADVVADRLMSAMGLEETAAPADEVAWAVRRLLEALARHRPVVVLFDDLHWAEPAFLDLVEHIADWSRDAPILLLCPSRPELLDQRPTWGGGKLNATSILLEPLSEGECQVLIENLLGRTQLPSAVRHRIAEAAEGNPLFVEEMLAMLIDDGLLRPEDEHWEPAGDLDRVPVPPTIQALLAARLDRLTGDELGVIERASVGGKVFYRGAVAELSPPAGRQEVGRHLLTLVRKELVRGERSTFAGDDAFRFRHMLVRDAAYESMPKELRAELHERFAGWLERTAGERVAEYDEILGHHLEEAYRYRMNLGLDDDTTASLGSRAADRLSQAGERALTRGDDHAAVNLLSRAVTLLRRDEPERSRITLMLAEALERAGEYGRALTELRVIEDLAGSAAQGRWPEHATIGRYWIETHRDPAFDLDAACSRVEAMIPVLEEAGDYLGLARAWSFLAERYLMQAQWQAMEEPLTRAIHHARRAGARRYEIRAVRRLANCAYWGPTLAASGVERCWSLLAQYRDNLSLESGIHAACGILEAQQGHWDEARSLLSRSNETLENLGNLVAVAGNRGFFSGPLEVLAGDLPAAERHLRFAQDELERVGEAAWRSTIAGYLADVVYRQGRFDEAESWAEIARLLSAPQDAVSQALWRSVRARVLARRGQFEDAEEVARDAVRTMEGTDQLDLRGDVCMARAEVLALAGRPAEARSTLAEAVRLYKAKGNIVSAGRAREAMADLAV